MNISTVNVWTKLSETTVFFGHRSVGNNIIDGIRELNKENPRPITILQSINKDDFVHPVFAHSLIGKNGDPISKINEFVNILKCGLADSLDIAFMKFCYVDIRPDTDIEGVFKYYQASIRSLQQVYPKLRFIHFTVPLTTRPKGIKGLARTILRKDSNKNRNEFNKLMRNSYSESELFDLAKIESTFPDDSQNIYWFNTPGLINEYTSDGRHLNELGSKLVAKELLIKIMTNLDSIK